MKIQLTLDELSAIQVNKILAALASDGSEIPNLRLDREVGDTSVADDKVAQDDDATELIKRGLRSLGYTDSEKLRMLTELITQMPRNEWLEDKFATWIDENGIFIYEADQFFEAVVHRPLSQLQKDFLASLVEREEYPDWIEDVAAGLESGNYKVDWGGEEKRKLQRLKGDPEIRLRFAGLLKEALDERGLSQSLLMKLLNVTRPQLNGVLGSLGRLIAGTPGYHIINDGGEGLEKIITITRTSADNYYRISDWFIADDMMNVMNREPGYIIFSLYEAAIENR